MNIKALLRTKGQVYLTLLAILAMVLVSGTGLYARGTLNGTWITNAKTGGPVDIRLATNAGQLSASFLNASSVTNYASLMGGVVTSKVTQGFDLSQLPGVPVVNPAYGSAGSSVDFAVVVTNLGNGSDTLTFGITNIIASGTWGTYASYSIYTNNNMVTPAVGPASAILYIYQGFVPGAVMPFVVRVAIPPVAVDGYSNHFQFYLHDGAPTTPGDSWPGPLAISPSLVDTNTSIPQRDYQNAGNGLVVRVSGPLLRLSKTVSVASLKPYQQMTYMIFYTNAGTATAQNVVIQDVMPAYTTNLVNARLSTNGAASNVTTPTIIGKRVQFGPGNVGAGKWGHILFTVQVK